MSDLPAFQRYQYDFASHIRDPRKNKRPRGVEGRRMKIYSELVYNNNESFLLSCFPVLRKVLGQRRWERLVREFLAAHRSHTPYFRQIPDEFLQFLQDEWTGGERYPDYVLELAHYEWIELVLAVSNRDEDTPAHDEDGDLTLGRPVLNPVLANLSYQWPVHRIRPRAKVIPDPTYLLVFRDAKLQLQFMQQSAVAARLLTFLEDGERTGEEAIGLLASEIGLPDPGGLLEFGSAHLRALKQVGAILGSRCEIELQKKAGA